MATGLAFLERLRSGLQPAPGIGALIGMRCVSVQRGAVSFALTPTPEHYNPLGTVHGGILSTMLDSAMSCAVHSTLDEGVSYTTLEIKINFLSKVTQESGEILATGSVIKVGRRIGMAEGRITNQEGGLIAYGCTTCLITEVV